VYKTQPAELRKGSLLKLIAELNKGGRFNKNDMLLRIGMPDSVSWVHSKHRSGGIIATSYMYNLAAGQYLLPDSQSVELDAGSVSDMCFDERVAHGPYGLPNSEIDDGTALLASIDLQNRSQVEKRSDGVNFRSDIWVKYANEHRNDWSD
jgi:hypothetical protein